MSAKNAWDAIAREGSKRDRLGQYARCDHCDQETDPRCLRQVELAKPGDGAIAVVLCAGCHLRLQGKPLEEDHHPAGRANDAFTVPIPANDHAVLSDLQHDWPTATLRNPDGSPLLAAAAALRGWLDVLRLLIERTVGWIPDALERLDDALREYVGPGWWGTVGWEGGRP